MFEEIIQAIPLRSILDITTTMSKINLHEDHHHHTDLSLIIETGNIKKIRELLHSFAVFNTSVDDIQLLKDVAIQAKHDKLVAHFELSKEAELLIYYDIKDQLDLMDADISDLVDS